MASLLGLGASNSKQTKVTPASTLRVQSSILGICRPIGWGQARLAGNLMWYGDFVATTVKSNQGGKGLGGGGSGKGSSGGQSYTYSAAVLIGIAEGPISGILNVWNNTTKQSLASLNLTEITGTYSQSAWGYLTSAHPDQALAYRGTAAVGAGPLQLGNSQDLPNLSYEVLFNYNSAISGFPDADPADVLTDLLTNPYYGIGFPSGNIGDLSLWSNYCRALGLVVSPVITSQAPASSFLTDLCKATNSELVWSGSTLTVVPYGTDTVTGNGYTYIPPSANLYDFGEADMNPNSNGPGGVGPVSMTRSSTNEEKNIVPVEYLDRSMSYNPNVVTATDQASVIINGPLNADKLTFHMFCIQAAAQMSAQLLLGRQKARNTGTIIVGPEYFLLDPMDLNEYVDAAFGADNQGIRITEIAENDDDSFTISFEEYGAGQGGAPVYGQQANSGHTPNLQVDPGDCLPPAIFDIPVALADTIGLRTWIATAGGVNWGGYNAFLSSDNITFDFFAQMQGASRMGVLSAAFPVTSDPDLTTPLSVDLSESFGELSGGTMQDADDGNTLCFVDGEYVSYQQATLTSQYCYDLGAHGATPGYVRRGLYGSAIGSHLSGSDFVRLDNQILEIPYRKEDVGKTIYIKLQSFNIWGGGIQDLSSLSSYAHVIGGPPVLYAPTGLTATPSVKSIQLKWINPVDIGVEAMEIWRSASSSFAGATHIADATAYSTSWTDLTVASNTQYWYWIRVRDIAGSTGAFDPSQAGPGATSVAGQAATADLADASVTSSKIAAGAINSGLLFAAGLTPVYVVNSLPAGTEGMVVVLTTNGKLYRYHAGAWTAEVPTVDLTGTISQAQIAAGAIDYTKVAAGLSFVLLVSSLPGSGTSGQVVLLSTDNQLYRWTGSGWTTAVPSTTITGTLTNAQIASIDAAKITSQITSTQIADNSISTPKLQAGSVTTNEIAANTITAGDIASNTITAAQIAAGTITATQIATNTITSSQIASNTIVAGNIAAATITGGLIAGGTITGSNIAALTITGGNIAANTITASHLTVDSVVAGAISVGAVNASAIIVNDIIVTGHLVANSVTSPSVSVGSSTAIASGSGWTTLTTITKSLYGGGNVMVAFSSYITWSSSGPRGYYQISDSNGNVHMTIGYGGGSCPDFLSTAGTGLDTTGQSGSVTYYLQANWTNGANQPTANIPALVVTELLR